MNDEEVLATARASLYLYNDEHDVDARWQRSWPGPVPASGGKC